MNPWERFFRRYILSTLGALVLFLSINLIIFLTVIFVPLFKDEFKGYFSIQKLSQHLSYSSDGSLSADKSGLNMLFQADAWAMVISDDGHIIWEERLPDELRRDYTLSETAAFSHWYLDGYPVRVWDRDDGLLVAGFPKGTYVRYNLIYKMDDFIFILTAIAAAFFINLLLLAGLLIFNARRVKKAMAPILNGIQGLSDGSFSYLPQKGELAEINASLNKAFDNLRKKDNTRGEWIQGISHDIRTPLSVILGYAGEMEDMEELLPAARKQAGIIRRQGEKLKALVDNLNLTTKLEYTVQPVQMAEIDPVELARQTVSQFIDSDPNGNWRISFCGEDPVKPFSFKGDPILLGRMLENLIRNSMIHNPEGCSIEISTAVTCTECRFIVSDDGKGMDEVLLEKLNKDSCTSVPQYEKNGLDHGLGLKIAGQVAAVHGGTILFSHVQPHGLEVTVRLPLNRS